MTPLWLERMRSRAMSDPTLRGEWADADTAGLRIRVRRGSLTWTLRYIAEDGRRVRFKVGQFPDVGLSAARKAAAIAKGRAAIGEDPQSAKRELREGARRRRVGENVSAAVRAWKMDLKYGPTARWKNGLEGGSARSFLPHINRLVRAFGSKLVSDLTPRDLERFVSAPEAAATRNRALTAARQFLAWARRVRLTAADPTANLTKEREVERTRVLSDEELRVLVRGFDKTRFGRAIRVLALTGLRRDEVLGMRWEWLDLDAGVATIPREAEKSGHHRGELRRVALSPPAVRTFAEQRGSLFAEGIRSEFVFSTTTGQRPHVDALKPILYRLRGRRSNGTAASNDKRAKARAAVLATDVTVHDIRRTVANALLNRLGVAPWIVDHVVLGHTRPKLLRTYMPTLPIGEAHEGLAEWAQEFERIVEGAASPSAPNVRPARD